MALVPRPKDKKGIRRFIGGTGFYSELVPGYAECSAPLHRCTKNDVGGTYIRGVLEKMTVGVFQKMTRGGVSENDPWGCFRK